MYIKCRVNTKKCKRCNVVTNKVSLKCSPIYRTLTLTTNQGAVYMKYHITIYLSLQYFQPVVGCTVSVTYVTTAGLMTAHP